MSDKHYPTDERGLLDAHPDVPAKPCARRLNWVNNKGIAVTWCTQVDGHGGECAGPEPRMLELNDLGPDANKRRRF